MGVDLYILRDQNCPRCGSGYYVALYEQSCSNGVWYPGTCGKLCLECAHFDGFPGRSRFDSYTGKNCICRNINLNDGRWDRSAVRLIRNMKDCDGDMDVAGMAEQLANERRRQQQQQAQAERLHQQRQQEAERLRRQQEQAERLRRQQEAERLRRQKEEQAKRDADRYWNEGHQALNRKDWNAAYQAFCQYRKLKNTYMGDYWCAYSQSKAGNADARAHNIIQDLADYMPWAVEQKEEHLKSALEMRARAYVAIGDKNSACEDFFDAGNLYYQGNNYKDASRMYEESMQKTGYYRQKDLFHVAYAYDKAHAPLSESEHLRCIKYYQEYMDHVSHGDSDAYGNIAYHYNEMGRYQDTVDLLKEVAKYGPRPNHVYGNLGYAYYQLEQWEQAEEEYLKCERYCGKDYSFKIGYACMKRGNHAEAKNRFHRCIANNDSVLSSYWNLGWMAKQEGNTRQCCEYRLSSIRAATEKEREKYDGDFSAWIRFAESEGFDDLARSMLSLLPLERARRDEARRKREEEERLAREREEQRRREEKARLAREREEQRRREEEARLAREREEQRKREEEERLLLLW